eukprot:6925109-Prymnesium_polylepis.1
MVTSITKTDSGRVVGPRLIPMPLAVLRYASFLGMPYTQSVSLSPLMVRPSNISSFCPATTRMWRRQ